jgi:NodT family efflux transporter outer membrane factor (OMF) lipoprotein
MQTMSPQFFALALAALLAGCASGPEFTAPAAPAVTRYTMGTSATQTAQADVPLGNAQRIAQDLTVEARWWRAFGSAALDDTIARALQASPTLAAAQARLAEAQALQHARSGAAELPQVDLGVGVQRQHASPAAQGQSGDGRTFGLYSASVGVHYQLDLSGANRRTLQALAARSDWRRHELAAAQLTLAGQIAGTAIARARLAAQIDASHTLLLSQQEQLALAQRRVVLGQAAPDEAMLLQSQAAQTSATLPLLRQQLQQADHQLAVLAGQAPGAAEVPAFTLRDFTLPTDLPLVVPSELVRRRPDIQASEALLHAAHAERGATIARRYPQLNLSAAIGSQALTSGALFGGASALWSLAGQLTQPLFNAAQPAQERAADAALDAAAAQYQSVVLQALRSVADALRAIANDAQALRALADADGAAQAALRTASERHRLGSISYAQLLLTQQQAQQVHMQLAGAQAQRLTDTVALYQAVGGDPLRE